MLGELGFAKPRQAAVEVGDREALPAQWRPGSTDHLKDMTQAPLTKPPHDCVPFGKQREVPELSPSKTLITHASTTAAHFLGYRSEPNTPIPRSPGVAGRSTARLACSCPGR